MHLTLKQQEFLGLHTISSVSYQFTEPEDYTGIDSKELTFNANQSKDCVNIMLSKDNILEQTEEFQVVLTSKDNQPVVLDTASVTVKILDTNSKY